MTPPTPTTTDAQRRLYLLPGLVPDPVPTTAAAASTAMLPDRAGEFETIIDSLGRIWNPLLHPRDKYGRFIRTFSRVMFSPKKRRKKRRRHEPTFYGDVLGFDRGTGDARIRVTGVDPGYTAHGLKPGDIVQVPQNQLETRLIKATIRDINGTPDTLNKGPRQQAENAVRALRRLGFGAEADRAEQAIRDGMSVRAGSSDRAIEAFRDIAETIDGEKARIAGVSDDDAARMDVTDIDDPGVRGQMREMDNIVRSLTTARHDLGDKSLPFEVDRRQGRGNEADRRNDVAKARLAEAGETGESYYDFRTGQTRDAEQAVPDAPRDQVWQQAGQDVLPELIDSLPQKIAQGLTRAMGIRRRAMVALKDRWHVDADGEPIFPGSVLDVAPATGQGGSVRPGGRMLLTRIHTNPDGSKRLYVRHFDPDGEGKGWNDYRVTSKNVRAAPPEEQSEALRNLAMRGESSGGLVKAFSQEYVDTMRQHYATPDAKRLSAAQGFFDVVPIDARVRSDAEGNEIRVGDWARARNGELGVVSWISGNENMLRLQFPNGQKIATISPKNVTRMHGADDELGYVPTRREAAAAARRLGADATAAVIEDPGSDHVAIKDAMVADPGFQQALKAAPELYARRNRDLSAGREPDSELKDALLPFDKLAAASAGQFREEGAGIAADGPGRPSADGTTDPPGTSDADGTTVDSDGTRTDTDTGERRPGAGGEERAGTIASPMDFQNYGISARFYNDLYRAVRELPEGPTRDQASRNLLAFSDAMRARDMGAFREALSAINTDLFTPEHTPALRGSALARHLSAKPQGRHSGERVDWEGYFGELEEHFPELFFRPIDTAGTDTRPGGGTDENIPISVDVSNDAVSRALQDGRGVFYGADGAIRDDGFAVPDQNSVEKYPDVPTADDVRNYLSDRGLDDGEYLAVHRDDSDGTYSMSRYRVFPSTEEGRSDANALAASTEANQFVDISSGEVFNVSGPDIAAGDEPSPTDRSTERAVSRGSRKGTARVARRTRKQDKVLDDVIASGPEGDARTALENMRNGGDVTAEGAGSANEYISGLPTSQFEGETAQQRNGSKGVVAQLADRVAQATGGAEPRGYQSANTALRRSSDIHSGVRRAVGADGDEELTGLMLDARQLVKDGDYAGAAGLFRDAADRIDAEFPEGEGAARAAQRAREHADRLDRTTGGGSREKAEITPTAEEAAPETAAPSAADIFREDGWDELDPDLQTAVERALIEALEEDPDLDLQRFRRSINGEETAEDIFLEDGWDELEPEERDALERALAEAREADPEFDVEAFRRDIVGEGAAPDTGGGEAPGDTGGDEDIEGPSAAPPRGLKGGLKKFAQAKAEEYARRDAEERERAEKAEAERKEAEKKAAEQKPEPEPEPEPEGPEGPEGDGSEPTLDGDIAEGEGDDSNETAAQNDYEQKLMDEIRAKYPELQALVDEVTQLPDEEYPLNEQQKWIVAAVATGKDTIVRALAGTGKTSTLLAAARRMRENQRGLYLAFNKPVQEEANEKFPGHVEARTANSMAWWAMRRKDKRYIDKLENGYANARDVADFLGISKQIRDPEGKPYADSVAVGLVEKVLHAYMVSADDELSEKHAEGLVAGRGKKAAPLPDREKRTVLDAAKRAWADYTDAGGQLMYDQDALVKMWALTRPDFRKSSSGIKKTLKDGDILFFDEAQDINDVLGKIVRDQQGIQTVTVGDSYQAIYGFRGAEDQLSKMTADYDLALTKSYRYGNGVASLGNRSLQAMGSDMRIVGVGPETDIYESGTMTDAGAVLMRTNRGAFREALEELRRGRTVGVHARVRQQLAQIVKTVGWLRDGKERPKDMELHPDLQRYIFRGFGRRRRELEPDEAWAAIGQAAGGDQPDEKVEKLLRIINDFEPEELDQILDKVRVMTSKKQEITPELLDEEISNAAEPIAIGDGLIGYLFDDGKKFAITQPKESKGATYRNLAFIKALTYGGARPKFDKSGTGKWVVPFRPGDPEFAERFAADLKELQDTVAPKIDVLIGTAHLSKGLEWDRVRLGDDWWQLQPKRDPETGEERFEKAEPEEERLFYVALTRAKRAIDPGNDVWNYLQEFSSAEPGEQVEPNKNGLDEAEEKAGALNDLITSEAIGGMAVPEPDMPGTEFDYRPVLAGLIDGDYKDDWDALTPEERRAATQRVIEATRTGGDLHPKSAKEFVLLHADGDLRTAAAKWREEAEEWGTLPPVAGDGEGGISPISELSDDAILDEVLGWAESGGTQEGTDVGRVLDLQTELGKRFPDEKMVDVLIRHKEANYPDPSGMSDDELRAEIDDTAQRIANLGKLNDPDNPWIRVHTDRAQSLVDEQHRRRGGGGDGGGGEPPGDEGPGTEPGGGDLSAEDVRAMSDEQLRAAIDDTGRKLADAEDAGDAAAIAQHEELAGLLEAERIDRAAKDFEGTSTEDLLAERGRMAERIEALRKSRDTGSTAYSDSQARLKELDDELLRRDNEDEARAQELIGTDAPGDMEENDLLDEFIRLSDHYNSDEPTATGTETRLIAVQRELEQRLGGDFATVYRRANERREELAGGGEEGGTGPKE